MTSGGEASASATVDDEHPQNPEHTEEVPESENKD